MSRTYLVERKYSSHRAGVTLVELLVVLAVMGLVAAGISSILVTTWKSHDTIIGQNEMQKWAQRTVDAVVDDLRGYSEIQAGDATQVTAVLKDEDEAVVRTTTFYLQGDELLRDCYESSTGQTITGECICGDVSALTFDYYQYLPASNSWQSPPLDLADTESLRVSVTIASGNNQATETSWVKFRNKI
ncbi:MAG: prepilin-type N-terminal cleavage/methylation domain-containing protein [Armatimonadetes bacterium]|nr:prepilin-type N-terminal cleavage/methylation domain-containing protein [Armatimonadota bacterium]NIM23523.1 prepilin-type N-terminal cleavage/methylation domain-containing protein [Armatimonadota bacterium]NIM67389.1 prepilin-type N-terminal cleavage/methylation domain-containing protein [Armatimonadota bacterium]NIM75890.1 prepilin-type N-terminal cleavage/methylation domain-containing protein [Armatimonadota bacterium]NIN05575.1 prepilin-type N-terminal cleavage/methylation domain-contain